MLVYDVTNRSSFEALNGWLKEMRTHLDSSSDMDSVVFIVCANKVLKKKEEGVPQPLQNPGTGSQKPG